MTQDKSVKLASVTAALTATAAAGYYAYDQYSKRFPRYQEQLNVYQQVSIGPTGLVCPLTVAKAARKHCCHSTTHIRTVLHV